MSTPASAKSENKAHAKSSDLGRWLWRGYLREHLGLLLLAALFMAMEGAMLGALSYMMQPMFDTVFVEGKGEILVWIGALLMGIFVIRAVAGVMRGVILTTIAQRCAANHDAIS